MNKRVIIAGVSISLITIAIIFVILKAISSNNSQPLVNQNTQRQITVKLPSTVFKDYTDSSGFAFQYPEDVKIEKNENVDQSVYTELLMTSQEVEGKILLKISDTEYEAFNDWLKANKELTIGLISKEASLSSLKATTLSNDKKILLLAFDQGVEFKVEVDLSINNKYWESVYDKILESFSFVAPSTNNSSTQSSVGTEDDIIFEGEEIIE